MRIREERKVYKFIRPRGVPLKASTNPSGALHHLPSQERLEAHRLLGEAQKIAVVYDAATAGIARTFCGMFMKALFEAKPSLPKYEAERTSVLILRGVRSVND